MAKAAVGKKKRKMKRTLLTPEERRKLLVKKDHIRSVRSVFKFSGFIQIQSLVEKEFEFEGSKCDFDDVYVLENVIVLSEYTCSNEEQVSAHLFKKKIIFDKIAANPEGFAKYLRESFVDVNNKIESIYENEHIKVVIIYCSRYSLKDSTKSNVQSVKFFDYSSLRYFLNISSTVKKSSRFEILEFLGIEASQFGTRILAAQSGNAVTYEGSVLPEAHSHFDPGYKVVSFYVDAEALLERAYVLRRDGWRTGPNIYQRMISRSKVEAIRKHLIDKKGVFINNIIVTLPDTTKLLDEKNNTIEVSKIRKTTPGRVQLPADFNSVGIIDGQHRVFSYHEGGTHEETIAKLRKQQNLLVTGIMFPSGTDERVRTRFEARLFLEINSNQSKAKSELKQEIGMILRPFSVESIARSVLNKLNEQNGPLNNEFEHYFWDKNKIKTTTVVSYGLIPLVRPLSEESLYAHWNCQNKGKMIETKDENTLHDYVEFCTKEINHFVSAVKSRIDKARWTADRKVTGRILTTTFINGLIACLRRIGKAGKLSDFSAYNASLDGINDFDLSPYKSSHYNNLGQDLAFQFFGIPRDNAPLEKAEVSTDKIALAPSGINED